ncbi:bile acid:Na+ symporter, BASS family [Balnearium lithotrophicum]|uniref:Bile acid:Na+ symporter, BASS family n=1 Tax=Balnearium lithotrophicum TaxID=223788 RepID=A0A521CV42_9BACT|nr:bile acid:sodium symporter family protein [Balnearium lithotrophicum]SMO63327.1 bile acid:Na+ symporter, BASS family [Balnearium lithotrophicum]
MGTISNFLWLWVLIIVPIALTFPFLFHPLKSVIKPLLGSVILSMGLTLKPSDFKEVFKRPKIVLIGILTQYSVMPFLGFIIGLILFKELSNLFLAGQVLTGSCPTGVVSNVYNFLAGSNLALSLSLSGVNTIVSPVLTPLLTKFLVGKAVNVDAVKLFFDMVQITLLPVLLGILINSKFESEVEKIKEFLPAYSTIVVVLIVGYVVSAGYGRILSLPLKSFELLFLASLFHLLFGFWLGYVIPRLLGVPKVERITISIETAMQNSGLAAVLAVSHWGALSALPAVFYSVVQNLIGPFVVKLFNWMIERERREDPPKD